jgi:hypothetical protein
VTAPGPSPRTASTDFRDTLRACWSHNTFRIGLVLSALHFAFMAFLTVYHTVVGTRVPDNATPTQVWAVLPPMEQKAVIASGTVFAIGIVLLAIGFARGLRGSENRRSVP